MIAGAAPRFEWRPNPDGATRSIDEACEIARRWGVEIPSYVQFSADEYHYLDEDTTARTTTFREFEGTIISWSWFFHKKTGKIPFLIRQDILASDEAIVAVIGHEMLEVSAQKGPTLGQNERGKGTHRHHLRVGWMSLTTPSHSWRSGWAYGGRLRSDSPR